jgi:hypothetical protein
VWPDISDGYFKSGPDNLATLENGEGPEGRGVRVTPKSAGYFGQIIPDLGRIIRS